MHNLGQQPHACKHVYVRYLHLDYVTMHVFPSGKDSMQYLL